MKKLLIKTRGRALILCLALTAVLVLTVGVAGAAEAKKQGVPNLKKGVTNLIETTTALVGFVADGSVLRLYNNSADENATALDLQVEPGNAPLTVNEEAGTATNLDADKVDGKDSTELVGQQGPKGDKGDKGDPGAPGPEGPQGPAGSGLSPDQVYVNNATAEGEGGGQLAFVDVECDEGDKALGGGGGPFATDEDELRSSTIVGSNQWSVTMKDNGNNGGFPDLVAAEVICADFPPLRGQ